MKNRSLKLIPFAVLLISACSIGQRPEMRTFTLDNVGLKTEKVSSACYSNISLQVNEPTAAPGLDSRRIAVIQNQNQLDYYNDVRWAGNVPDILQSLMIEIFEQSKAFKAVTTDIESANSTIVLLTDIRDFEVVDDGYPEVRIKLVAKLLNKSDSSVISSTTVERTFKPEANKIESIVASFNEGSVELTKEILSKLNKSCK